LRYRFPSVVWCRVNPLEEENLPSFRAPQVLSDSSIIVKPVASRA